MKLLTFDIEDEATDLDIEDEATDLDIEDEATDLDIEDMKLLTLISQSMKLTSILFS